MPVSLQSRNRQRVIVCLLGLYCAWQCLFPLRHFLYPGNTAWTEVGHRFSWRMMLRNKPVTGQFIVRNRDTGETRAVNPANYLKHWQNRDMLRQPYMIWQFSRFLEQEFRKEWGQDVQVYGWIQASLNGRPFQAYIDPSIDLTEVPFLPHSNPWVMPLSTSLRP